VLFGWGKKYFKLLFGAEIYSPKNKKPPTIKIMEGLT
jgi:hypothetical protein